MKNYLILLGSGLMILLSGCASTPMANSESDGQAEIFVVKPGRSNIYVYRNESIGAGVKMDVVLDGKHVGQTAARSYFVLEVSPGKHKLVSKAENVSMLDMSTEEGKSYYVWQEVEMGLMYARNKLQLVDEAIGKSGVAESKLIESAFTPAAAQQTIMPARETSVDALSATPAVDKTSSNPLPAQSESAAGRLRTLHELYKDGVIDQKDFDAKKQEILKSM